MEYPKVFDIELYGHPAQVSDHSIRSARVFHVIFGDGKRRPLNITIAESDGVKFWTSIPEGRQEEAEFAGKVIAAYIRDYRRNPPCVTTTDKKLAAPSLFD